MNPDHADLTMSNYRINQLQVSGTSGCVTATALNRPTLGREGRLALSIGENVAILTAAQAETLAAFLTMFEPGHEVNG